MKPKVLEKNMHDINKLPQTAGLLVFGVSISKISNAQSPEKCWEYLQIFWDKIVKTEGVGAVFLYSDYLYMYTDQGSPIELRTKYLELMLAHKNSLLNILGKNQEWIRKSFTFLTWGQLLVGVKNYTNYFAQLKNIYENDSDLQNAVVADAQERGLGEGQVSFLLEESLVLYLISKGQVPLYNEYINHHEKWVLNCYPGKPLETESYLYKNNILGLKNRENKYEDAYYDLDEKILYDFGQL